MGLHYSLRITEFQTRKKSKRTIIKEVKGCENVQAKKGEIIKGESRTKENKNETKEKRKKERKKERQKERKKEKNPVIPRSSRPD